MLEILEPEEIRNAYLEGIGNSRVGMTYDEEQAIAREAIATAQRDKDVMDVVRDLRNLATVIESTLLETDPYYQGQITILNERADEYERQVSNGEDS